MENKRILVFPCGSEIGHEIFRSMQYSRHFELFGASSVDDHGRFLYKKYIGGLPFISDPAIYGELKAVINSLNIDAVYPTMDLVATSLKQHENELGCLIIGSSTKANTISSSKSLTYRTLRDVAPCPEWTDSVDEIKSFPVFAKPDVGYGTRNTFLASSRGELECFLQKTDKAYVFCEYLPGKEYTVDCFSNKYSDLLFSGARERVRTANGISVKTRETNENREFFLETADRINRAIKPRGAWFFQMKESENGAPILLEIATRLGGSSSLFRMKGINFALLTCFDAFDVDVSIVQNDYEVELDRALDCKYKVGLDYDSIYLDYDDCLIIDGLINTQMIKLLYQAINEGKKLFLLTRNPKVDADELLRHRIPHLFDGIFYAPDGAGKSEFIDVNLNPVFIDDSFAERKEVSSILRIPTFSPDMVDSLFS